MTNDTVEYRDVPNFPGRRVGSDGSVWGCLYPKRGGKRGEQAIGDWRRLCTRVLRSGYEGIVLSHLQKNTHKLIHHIVLEAFIGPRPSGKEARHLNGNRLDNRLCNLSWGTKRENMDDRKKHGREYRACGEKNPAAKLSCERVVEIRDRCAGGESHATVASDCGVSRETVSMIARRATWAHLNQVLSIKDAR